MRMFCFLSLLLLTACVEHTPPVERIAADENQWADTLQQKNYKTTRIFAGTLPCADCGGIEQQLILKGDTTGIYQLRETYLQATEDGDEVLISTGEWASQKKTGKEIYYLSEHNLRDSTRIIRYSVSPGQLLQLDPAGNPIAAGTYKLHLKGQH